MQRSTFLTYPVAISAAMALAACGSSSDSAPTTSAPAQTSITASVTSVCAALDGKAIGGAQIVKTTVVPASATLPAYCTALAKMEPNLNFEVRFPEGWNGKLLYSGGGGYNGWIIPVTTGPTSPLGLGYVNVATDSGHTGSPFDASFAVNNPTALQLYGKLSTPTVMASAIEIVNQAYGKTPQRSYFEGCSNGGREALMMAQRFPNLFDGIVAKAPAYNFTGVIAGAMNRNARAVAAAKGTFTSEKIALLAKSTRNACDAKDGIVDGLVSNPAACTKADFDFEQLRCAGGGDTGNTCLSDVQLAVVRSWTEPLKYGTNPGYRNAGWALTGNEDDPGSWPAWLINPKGEPTQQFLLQDTTIKTFINANYAENFLTYSAEQDPSGLQYLSSHVDATDTDLRPYKRSAGKLILWHGANDSALSVKSTTEYYNGVQTSVGGEAALKEFVRYYIAPGVNHCSGGPGADKSDLVTALDKWVEKNEAPGTLSAARLVDGKAAMTRPLCVHPQYARYVGPANDATAGNLAANYVCTNP